MYSKYHEFSALLSRATGVNHLRGNFLRATLSGGHIDLPAPFERH
jgi:hypothetical protein